MSEERTFKANQVVYVVDYWGTNIGSMAFSARAEIIFVDEIQKTFVAVLYGDSYNKYSFKDYKRLIFDTIEEANEAASKFPIPTSVVYQNVGNVVCEKKVDCITGNYADNVWDLFIEFDDGSEVSSKELGISIYPKDPNFKQ